MDSPLKEPVTVVKGVGPAMAERLGKLGVATVRDLLWHFPRDYQDRSRLTAIAEVRPGTQEAVMGVVREVKVARWRRRGGVLTAIVEDETGRIAAMWFGMPYLGKQLEPGTRLVLWGKVTVGRRGLTILSPEFERLGADEPLHAERIVPIYPATAGIGQKRFRRLLRAALDAFGGAVPEAPNYHTFLHPGGPANTWVTATGVYPRNYFDAGQVPPQFLLDLAGPYLLTDLIVWGYGGNANEASDFTVEFSRDGGASFYASVDVQANYLIGQGMATLPFGGSFLADTVRLTMTDNAGGRGLGGVGPGDRVGLGEVKFLAIPEPGTLALVGVGLLALLRRRRA